MIRWMRLAAIGLVTLAIAIVGVGVGLFLIENDRWEAVELHPWLRWVFGDTPWEVWMPTLFAGWLVAVIGIGALFLWSVFYVWRRRQYEGELRRLRRELVALRNLPFEAPAPFEDQDELPDPEARRIMALVERGLPSGRPGVEE